MSHPPNGPAIEIPCKRSRQVYANTTWELTGEMTLIQRVHGIKGTVSPLLLNGDNVRIGGIAYHVAGRTTTFFREGAVHEFGSILKPGFVQKQATWLQIGNLESEPMRINIKIFNSGTNEMSDDPQTIQEWFAGEHNGGFLYPDGGVYSDKDYDHLIFLLGTGMYDETGEEIYADDIVKQGHEAYLFRVTMHSDGCWWALSLMPTILSSRLSQLHHPRIVGNMHENPELHKNRGVEDPC